MCDSPTRRRLVRALGLAAVGGLAGCSSDDGERTATGTATPTGSRQSRDLPPYATFVPDTADAVLVTMSDLRVDSGHRVGSPPETVRDPLRYGSMTAAYVGSLLELSVYGTGFGFELGRLDISGVQRALTVGTVGVLELPVDLDGAIADAKDGDGTVRFEADDRALITDADGALAGLTTDAVVFTPPRVGTESPDRVRAIVDTRAGVRRPKHETDDAFASLLAEAGDGGSLACGYAPDGAVETLARARTASTSVSIPTGDFGAATGALFRIDLDNGEPPQPATGLMRFPEDTGLDPVAATESVGSAATDRAVTRGDRTVRVTGTYDWDALAEFEGSLLDGL